MFIRLFVCFGLLCSTTAFATMKKVCAFSGSIRQDSYNRELLQEAITLLEAKGVQVTFFDLREHLMPFYNADEEAASGLPNSAKQMRQAMIESDAVLIASPEYNSALTAVLKNTIDWVSRGEEGGGSLTPFKEKTFFIISASPGRGGGARSLTALRSILSNMGGNVDPMQVTVPVAHETMQNPNAPYKQELIALTEKMVAS